MNCLPRLRLVGTLDCRFRAGPEIGRASPQLLFDQSVDPGLFGRAFPDAEHFYGLFQSRRNTDMHLSYRRGFFRSIPQGIQPLLRPARLLPIYQHRQRASVYPRVEPWQLARRDPAWSLNSRHRMSGGIAAWLLGRKLSIRNIGGCSRCIALLGTASGPQVR